MPAAVTTFRRGSEPDIASLTLKALREIDDLIRGKDTNRENLRSLTELLGSEIDPNQNYNWKGLTPATIGMYVRAAEAANKKEVSSYEELRHRTDHIVRMMLNAESKEQLEAIYAFLEAMHRALIEMRHASMQARGGRHSSRR